MTYLKLGVLAVLAVAVIGCGGAPASSSDQTQRAQTASYAVTMSAPILEQGSAFKYDGNYVQIYGKRDGWADFKYPCASEFRECVELDSGGRSKTVVKDLCPTENVTQAGTGVNNTGKWTFSYKVWLGPCGAPGSIELTLKDGTDAVYNLMCEDSSLEPLHAGELVTNSVICKTWNAGKEVQFCIYDENSDRDSQMKPIARTGDCAALPEDNTTCTKWLGTCSADADCCSGKCGALLAPNRCALLNLPPVKKSI